MSVNVSSLQLTHPDFVSQRPRARCKRREMTPAQLTLEVTESVLMDGIENAVSTLTALRDMGVQLSIDDFGTGYSSLSYLATLPIDALKVDRSFIDRMSRDGEGSEIVKAIFKLGQALSQAGVRRGHRDRRAVDAAAGAGLRVRPGLPARRARWTRSGPAASSPGKPGGIVSIA